MKGTIVYVESRVPTAWEYENCRIVELTVDTLWNPGEVNICASASTKEHSNRSRIETSAPWRKFHGIGVAISTMRLCVRPFVPGTCNLNRPDGLRCTSDYCKPGEGQYTPGICGRQGQTFSGMRRNNCSRVLMWIGNRTAHFEDYDTALRSARNVPASPPIPIYHLNLHRRRLLDVFYMDTLFSKVKSLSGFTCAQLITNGSFTRVYPIESKASSNIATVLQEFIDDVGMPEILVCDFVSEQTGKKKEVMKIIRHANIKLRIAEKGRGITQNHRAETETREIKTKWKSWMRSNQVPVRLWDYGLV